MRALALTLFAVAALLATSAGAEHVCKLPHISAADLILQRVKPRRVDPLRVDTAYPNLKIDINWDNSILSLPNRDEVYSYTEQALQFWSKSLLVKYPSEGKIFVDKQCFGRSLVTTIGGVQRTCCVETLGVRCRSPTPCNGEDIPERVQRACCWCSSNDPATCRLEGEDGEGMNGDFLMLTIAKQKSGCLVPGVLAYAGACYLEMSYFRPIVGVVNLCASVVNHTSGLDRYSEVQVIKHEISHALGFNSALYGLWRAQNGSSLSPINEETGMPNIVNGSYEVSDQVVRRVTRDWQTVSGLLPREFTYIVTPTVTQVLRDYFNCPQIEGAEIENHGSSGTAGSHFEKRIFPSEAMNGVLSEWMNMSSISLALMQDTGWYVANFSNAETYDYGKGLGCGFARDSCMTWIREKRENGQNPAPYCDRLSSPTASRTERRGTCTEKHDQVAQCTLVKYTSIGNASTIDPMYRYFDSVVPNGSPTDNPADYGGFEYADYCPYLQLQNIPSSNPEMKANRYRMCKHSAANEPIKYDPYFETYGPSSICLRQATPTRTFTCIGGTTVRLTDELIWGAGCYEVRCESDAVRVMAQDRTLFKCDTEFAVLNFETSATGKFYQGTLVCPSCTDACGSKACPMKRVNQSTVNDEYLLELATQKNLVNLTSPSPSVCFSQTELVTANVRVESSNPDSSLATDLPVKLFELCGASPSSCAASGLAVKSSRAGPNNYEVIIVRQDTISSQELAISYYVAFTSDSDEQEPVIKSVTTTATKQLSYVITVGEYLETPGTTASPTTPAPTTTKVDPQTSFPTTTKVDPQTSLPTTTKVDPQTSMPTGAVTASQTSLEMITTSPNVFEIIMWVLVGIAGALLVTVVVLAFCLCKANSKSSTINVV